MRLERFHHLGVAVPEIGPAVESMRAMFGYEVTAGPVTDPIQKVHVCFLRTAQPDAPTLELVAPAAPDSPVGQVLTKGGGAYHLCYEVPDLDAALATARAARWVVVSRPVPAVAFGGRRIAWLYTPTRQLIELLELTHRSAGTP